MKFEIGEIAVVQNSYEGYNGAETEIIGGLSLRFTAMHPAPEGAIMYRTRVIGETTIRSALPSQLKKKPPSEDIEEIDWIKLCNLKVLEAV